MVNRRTALKLGATGIAGGFMHVPGLAYGLSARSGDFAPLTVLYDSRFRDSVDFAQSFSGRGATAIDIRGDLAGIWYRRLRGELARETAPVIGLTERLDLFCLEELARDVRMQAVFRAERLLDGNGGESGFGRDLAEQTANALVAGRRDPSAGRQTGPYSPAGRTALAAWIIA